MIGKAFGSKSSTVTVELSLKAPLAQYCIHSAFIPLLYTKERHIFKTV